LLLLQVMRNMPQQDFARQMLSEIKSNPRFPPFVAAVDDAVDALLEDAVEIARTVGVLSNSNHDSSSYRRRDQGGIPPAAQAAANYYWPVLTQLFEAVLKLHLQVQGTNSTAYVFVPGKQPPDWTSCCLVTPLLVSRMHQLLFLPWPQPLCWQCGSAVCKHVLLLVL
jgi:hypothetical protein